MELLKRRLSSLAYDGTSYPVYSVVPKNVTFNYVIMSPVDLVDDSAKGINSYECTQLFDIITFGGERGSWKACNSLAGQIMDEIMKEEIKTQNWQTTVEPIIDSTNSFIEATEGGVIMRKLIRFRYNLQQINN